MSFINVGKTVNVKAEDISYFCAREMAPEEHANKATDLSGGTKRTLIVLNNKVAILVDVSAQTLLARINSEVNKK